MKCAKIMNKSLKMDEALVGEVTRVARLTNRSFSGMIRQAAIEYVDRFCKDEKEGDGQKPA